MNVVDRLMADIPALAALRGFERFCAEEAIDAAIAEAVDVVLDAIDAAEAALDPDPDPDPGGGDVVPFRKAA